MQREQEKLRNPKAPRNEEHKGKESKKSHGNLKAPKNRKHKRKESKRDIR